MHVAPFEKGTPTVIAQVGKFVYRHVAGRPLPVLRPAGGHHADPGAGRQHQLRGLPRLASFAAADSFLPRQLQKRGHRLVFSQRRHLPVRRGHRPGGGDRGQGQPPHPALRHRRVHQLHAVAGGYGQAPHPRREPGWKRGLFINGTGAVLSLVVDIIICITKFTEGGWVIIAIVPILVAVLLRLNRQYVEEAAELQEDAPLAAAAPIMARHVVLVFVDQLDMAAARAIQYARTLTPDDLRAVHFAVDAVRASELRRSWRSSASAASRSTSSNAPTALTRAAVELVADGLADGNTEVTVLLLASSTPAAGIASCTTARPTPSPKPSPTSRTPT